MPDFEKGYLFRYGEEVTADKLRRLVEDGRLTTPLNRTYADSAYSFITKQATEISSPSDKEVWLNVIELSKGDHTSFMYHLQASVSGLAGWFAVDSSHVTVYNGTGGTLTVGSVLMPAGTVTYTTGGWALGVSLGADIGGDTERSMLGVAADHIPDGEYGLCVVHGRAVAHVEDTSFAAGTRIVATGTPGQAGRAVGTTPTLTGFAITLSVDNGDENYPRADAWLYR